MRLIVGARTLSSTELNLTWSRPDQELINGRLYAYKVVYFASGTATGSGEASSMFQQFVRDKNLIDEVKRYLNEAEQDDTVVRNGRVGSGGLESRGVSERDGKVLLHGFIVCCSQIL